LPIRQVGPLQGRAPNTGGITMGSNNFAASPGMSTPMQRAPAQQDNSAANGMAGLSMLNEAGALDPLKGFVQNGINSFAPKQAMSESALRGGAFQGGGSVGAAAPKMAMPASALQGGAFQGSGPGAISALGGSAGDFAGLSATQLGGPAAASNMFGGAATALGGPAGIAASSAPMMAAGSLTGATALPASALVGGAAQGAGLAASAPAFLGMGPLGWAALAGVGLLTAFG